MDPTLSTFERRYLHYFNTKKPPFQVILLRVPLKTAFAAAITRQRKCCATARCGAIMTR